MHDYSAFKQLLLFLADLYRTEGRAGGDQAAAALYNAVDRFPRYLPEPYNYLPGAAETALKMSPHPKAEIVAAALPLIRWFRATDSMQSIGDDVGARMLVSELIGPDGMIYCADTRVGLFVQCPNLDYPTRKHGAEETYVVLGGEAYWNSGTNPPALKKTGDWVYHRSHIAHRSLTVDKPTIAAWRWTGDIRYEAYACAG
ncbi:MAG: dimethylsulfonioproprionate lyase family protein [Pseudomonadota bacterium]